jgi:hypothetical protein
VRRREGASNSGLVQTADRPPRSPETTSSAASDCPRSRCLAHDKGQNREDVPASMLSMPEKPRVASHGASPPSPRGAGPCGVPQPPCRPLSLSSTPCRCEGSVLPQAQPLFLPSPHEAVPFGIRIAPAARQSDQPGLVERSLSSRSDGLALLARELPVPSRSARSVCQTHEVCPISAFSRREGA